MSFPLTTTQYSKPAQPAKKPVKKPETKKPENKPAEPKTEKKAPSQPGVIDMDNITIEAGKGIVSPGKKHLDKKLQDAIDKAGKTFQQPEKKGAATFNPAVFGNLSASSTAGEVFAQVGSRTW